jgi:hypothetical protein
MTGPKPGRVTTKAHHIASAGVLMFDSGKSSKYRIAIDEKITSTIDISATVANVPFARFRNK